MSLLTVQQVAERLSISQSLAYRLVADGKLRAYRIGKGTLRFSEEMLCEYLSSCELHQGNRRTRTSSGSPVFKHLDASRLAAAWREQGVS